MLIKCYAEGRPGRWEAVCLNFDIAVQGSTLDEAMDCLNEAIDLYMDRLNELEPRERARFLRRKSPLSLQLKFLWHVLRSTIFHRDDSNGKARAEFILPRAA